MSHTSPCTPFRGNREKCLAVPKWTENGDRYQCHYRRNNVCAKQKITSSDNVSPSQEHLQTQIQGIQKEIQTAMRNQERTKIIQLLKSRQQLQQQLDKLLAHQTPTTKHPRQECQNSTCQLENGETGLEDPITQSCDYADQLTPLSDGYCYLLPKDEDTQTPITRHLNTQSRHPKKSVPKQTLHTLEDYHTVFGKERGNRHFHNQQYNTLYYQWDDILYEIQPFLYQQEFLDNLLFTDHLSIDDASHLATSLAETHAMDPDTYDQWVDLEYILEVIDYKNRLRHYQHNHILPLLTNHLENRKHPLHQLNRLVSDLMDKLPNYSYQTILEETAQHYHQSSNTFEQYLKRSYPEIFDTVMEIINVKKTIEMTAELVSKKIEQLNQKLEEMEDKMVSLLRKINIFQMFQRYHFLPATIDKLEPEIIDWNDPKSLKKIKKRYQKKDPMIMLALETNYAVFKVIQQHQQNILLPYLSVLHNDEPKKDYYQTLSKFQQLVQHWGSDIHTKLND